VFQKQAANIIQAATSGGDDFCDSFLVLRESHVGAEFDGIGEGDDDDKRLSSAEEHDQTQSTGNSAVNDCAAEYISLRLPSNLGRDWCDKNDAKDLVKAELRLREGQLNDCLYTIQLALGQKIVYVQTQHSSSKFTETQNTCLGGSSHYGVNSSASCLGIYLCMEGIGRPWSRCRSP
jgi:hypothetical protein